LRTLGRLPPDGREHEGFDQVDERELAPLPIGDFDHRAEGALAEQPGTKRRLGHAQVPGRFGDRVRGHLAQVALG